MIWETIIKASIIAFWLVGGSVALLKKNKASTGFLVAGLMACAFLLGKLWLQLDRPPLQTLNETRYWFSFFLATLALGLQLRSRQKGLIFFAALAASGFISADFIWPQVSRSSFLSPVLRSPFFIPHVTAYLLAYAILALAGALSYRLYRTEGQTLKIDKAKGTQLNRLIIIGLAFLILGLSSGATWAEEAWGRFWGWDPKETWAFVAMTLYLIFIHLRLSPRPARAALLIPPGAILLILFTWLAQAILPAAENSLHLY